MGMTSPPAEVSAFVRRLIGYAEWANLDGIYHHHDWETQGLRSQAGILFICLSLLGSHLCQTAAPETGGGGTQCKQYSVRVQSPLQLSKPEIKGDVIHYVITC